MREKSTIIIATWSNPKVALIRDDVMLPLAPGIYFHYRLASTIIVTSELPEHLRNAVSSAA